MSLSCIVQTLWDVCQCQVLIEATVPLFVIRSKWMQTRARTFYCKMKRDVRLLMASKKKENLGDGELTLSQRANNDLETDKCMAAIPT